MIPLGVVEKHGEHLPLGTDYLFGHLLAGRAAEMEEAIVFPPYYFGQIHEARHQPGTIAIDCDLMTALLDNVCQEISRNGMRKIVLMNCHGGNCAWLKYFLQRNLERQRGYMLYLIDLGQYLPHADAGWQAMRQGPADQHAGESETSAMLAGFPKLVRMTEIGGNPNPLERLKHFGDVGTSVNWYADFPDHYAGDASTATAEKGRYVMEYMAKQVAMHLGNIKRDQATAELLAKFHADAVKAGQP